MKTYIALTVSVAACLAASASFAGEIAAKTSSGSGPVDFANAKPMPLPQGVGSGESLRDALAAPPAKLGPMGSTPGFVGDGNLRPTKVPFRKASGGGDRQAGHHHLVAAVEHGLQARAGREAGGGGEIAGRVGHAAEILGKRRLDEGGEVEAGDGGLIHRISRPPS